MRVFYMTSAKWAEVILNERRLKLARFGELNDPFELSLIDNRPRETRGVVKLINSHFQDTIGVICFGQRARLPPKKPRKKQVAASLSYQIAAFRPELRSYFFNGYGVPSRWV